MTELGGAGKRILPGFSLCPRSWNRGALGGTAAPLALRLGFGAVALGLAEAEAGASHGGLQRRRGWAFSLLPCLSLSFGPEPGPCVKAGEPDEGGES